MAIPLRRGLGLAYHALTVSFLVLLLLFRCTKPGRLQRGVQSAHRTRHDAFVEPKVIPVQELGREFPSDIWSGEPVENLFFVGDIDRVRPTVTSVADIKLATGERPQRHIPGSLTHQMRVSVALGTS